MFADIHCHPHYRAYQWLVGSKLQKKEKHYHPWNIVLSYYNGQDKGTRATNYSQCDLAKLTNGEVKLVIASLYPIERGFFTNVDAKAQDEICARYELEKEVFEQSTFNRILSRFTKSVLAPGSLLRNVFQSVFMDVPGRRVKQVVDPSYDYYASLQEEYTFIKTKNGEETEAKLFIPYNRNDVDQIKSVQEARKYDAVATGSYTIASNATEAEQAISNGGIAFLLSIEGAHALGSDTVDEATLMQRIDEVRAWNPPVFFITFAHHFDNGLCGHAHSLPAAASLLTDQSANMDKGFNDKGRRAIRHMLALDGDNNRLPNVRRILIDVKHMSACARKEFYEEIIYPCLNKGDTIPVIASHCGYAGVKTLDELVQNLSLEEDDYIIDDFYAWSINCCDDDVIAIAKTRGLFGLSFDQRILGFNKERNPENSIITLWNNIKAVLDVVIDSDQLSAEEKSRAWELIAIGSDNEGFIDPVDKYSSALQYGHFQRDLITVISEQVVAAGQGNRYFLADNHAVTKVVRQICFENTLEFVKRNF